MAMAFETGAPRNHTALGLDSCDDDIVLELRDSAGGDGGAGAILCLDEHFFFRCFRVLKEYTQ